MALTFADVEDAIMEGERVFQKIKQSAQADFYRPVLEQQLTTLLASMPPEQMAALAQADPMIMTAVRKMARGKPYGKN